VIAPSAELQAALDRLVEEMAALAAADLERLARVLDAMGQHPEPDRPPH
jgi:hypothetical protein